MYAKVIAYNLYGDSELSNDGNGALMVQVPDAPTSMANDLTETTKDQIGITWNVVNHGGMPVIDHRI